MLTQSERRVTIFRGGGSIQCGSLIKINLVMLFTLFAIGKVLLGLNMLKLSIPPCKVRVPMSQERGYLKAMRRMCTCRGPIPTTSDV